MKTIGIIFLLLISVGISLAIDDHAVPPITIWGQP